MKIIWYAIFVILKKDKILLIVEKLLRKNVYSTLINWNDK